MRPIIFVFIVLIIASCKYRDKNFDGTVKNYIPLTRDTNCINAWSAAYFELNTKNFDTVILAIKTKLVAVLGANIFNEMQVGIMSDSIRKAVFNTGLEFISGDIEIDTTNLLRLNLKEDISHYLSDQMNPRKSADWKSIFTQFDQFTYQKTPNFEIGYTITPCIKKILRYEGKFKRQRKGNSLSSYSKEATASIDEINIYDCILNISILIDVDDKSWLIKDKRQFYEIKITDTAKVFTTIDLYLKK